MAAPTWTKPRRRALEQYLRDLAPVLRLSDWTLKVAWDHVTPGAVNALSEVTLATIVHTPYSKHATVRVSPALLALPAAEQTQALVHELVHCHLFALAESTRATFTLLGKGEQRVAERAFNQHLECTTDALADAFAPLAPPFAADPAH